MYIEGIIYFFLAIYLNEVIPQKYGVPKHPLFLFEGFIQRNFPSMYKKIFDDQEDLKLFKDDSELGLEDNDAKEERQLIYNMDL